MKEWAPFCRACLAAEDLKSIVDDGKLKEEFSDVTSIQLLDQDSLIAFICENCIQILHSAHQFKKQCLYIESQLKSQLLKIVTDFDPKETNAKEIKSNMEVVESETQTQDACLENELDEDELYVLVVKNEEHSNVSNDESLTIKEEERPNEINSFHNIFSPDDNELYKLAKTNIVPKPIKLEYDNVVNENDIRLHENDTKSPQKEDNVDFSQKEVIVSNAKDCYEIINCDISEINIESLEQIGKNNSSWQPSTKYACDCGYTADDLFEFDKHLVMHDKSVCHSCGSVETKEVMPAHAMLHERTDAILSCPYCSKNIKRNFLVNHVLMKHTQYRPTCDICKRTFATEHNRKRHMLTHLETRTKSYSCDVCRAQFSQQTALHEHRLLHETSEYLDCNSDGDALGSLIMEKIDRDGETESLCFSCGIVFPSKMLMSSHVCVTRCATTARPKSLATKNCCKVCGKVCPSHAMLLMHERVHTNERPYKCSSCPLAFKTKTHLRTHHLTHTQIKNYKCTHCTKAFSLKGNLVVHLRSHTGEKPYECNLCDQAFIDSKYLKKHKLRKHVDTSMW